MTANRTSEGQDHRTARRINRSATETWPLRKGHQKTSPVLISIRDLQENKPDAFKDPVD